jgi:hypothetical protein
MVRQFKENNYKFPRNPGNGFYRNEVVWADLSSSRAYQVLKNHVYAGAYSYGRHQVERTVAGTKTAPKPPDEWHAYMESHHDGYISMEEYEWNISRLGQNRIMKNGSGPALEGAALLQGIALCGKCGAHMRPQYHRQGEGSIHNYCCRQEAEDYGGSACQSIHGIAVDQAVSGVVLAELTPLAISKAIAVQRGLDRRDGSSESYFAMQVESARYKAELARRRYNSVDPDNRLVAFELERLWNLCLEELASAEDEQRRYLTAKEKSVAKYDAESLLSLPGDVESLWNSANASISDKKRIIRCIIEDVTLLKDGGKIHVGIRFKTGSCTELWIDNPLRPYEKHVLPESTLEIIRREAEKHNSGEITKILNGMGLKSATGLTFTERIVLRAMRAHDIPTCKKMLERQGYVTLPEKAKEIGIPWRTLYHQVMSGKFEGDCVRAGEKGNFMFL